VQAPAPRNPLLHAGIHTATTENVGTAGTDSPTLTQPLESGTLTQGDDHARPLDTSGGAPQHRAEQAGTASALPWLVDAILLLTGSTVRSPVALLGSTQAPTSLSTAGGTRDLILDYFYWGAEVLFYTRVLLLGVRGFVLCPCSFIQGIGVI